MLGQVTDKDETAPEPVNKDKVEVLVPLQPLCARFTVVPVAHVRAELWLMPELQPKKPTAGAHPEGKERITHKTKPDHEGRTSSEARSPAHHNSGATAVYGHKGQFCEVYQTLGTSEAPKCRSQIEGCGWDMGLHLALLSSPSIYPPSPHLRSLRT